MAEAWITLLRFATVHEGEMARGMLETAGIQAVLLDSGMVGMAWHLAPAIGGVRLQVRPEDREEALAVLAGDEADIGASWDDADAPRPRLVVFQGGAERTPAAASRPAALPNDEVFDEDADEAAQLLARRALGAALLGVLIPFVLHIYSAILLLRLAQSPGYLNRRSRAWAAMALAIDALVLIPALLFLAKRVF